MAVATFSSGSAWIATVRSAKCTTPFRTAEVGRKKRTGEPITYKSDLAAFENALNTTSVLASGRLYGFDSFDVPTMINYPAINDLIENNENGHKNCYIYRDTYGSGE